MDKTFENLPDHIPNCIRVGITFSSLKKREWSIDVWWNDGNGNNVLKWYMFGDTLDEVVEAVYERFKGANNG
jgi:hypothetical protein